MNRSDFLRMIESYGPADRTAVNEVNELTGIFPYCQSAYLLLLKGLRNTEDVRFENQLRLSALHVADREVLYYLLKKVPASGEIITRDKEEEPAVEIATDAAEQKPVSFEEFTADSQQTVIETAMNSEELINEIEREARSDNSVPGSGDSSIVMTVESHDNDRDATIFLIDEETGSIEERIVYMDPGFSCSEPEELLELITSPGPDETPVSSGEQSSPKQIQSDLIDRFINANPRIEPSKDKPEIPEEDLSKPFVEEGGEFITETLARIYVKQGYYSKAMDIYEKLSLKFPEKSSYFASQIEKVKELLKK